MKKLLALGLIFSLTFSLCACGTQSADPYTPPVQGGYTPPEQPTEDIPIKQTEFTKFDFVEDDDSAIDIWHRAYQYLYDSDGLLIDIQNPTSEVTTLQLNNKTGESRI